jgi:hypothetical protein
MGILAILATVAAIACSSWHCPPSTPAGRAFREADGLFHRDPRWLGADGALSVPLSEHRLLWLFGDTFVATSTQHVRSEAVIVRNTVAIQEGADPRTAAIAFHWRQDGSGMPASFFPERAGHWFWPGQGIRLAGGPLVIFLYAVSAAPGRDLGFAITGHALAVIDNPDGPPPMWNLRLIDGPALAFDAVPATALVQDGAHVVAVAIRQQGTHAGALVRYPAAFLEKGDVASAQWWAGDSRGWVPTAALGAQGPAFVMDDAGSECSLHWDQRTKSFIHIASYGFGASTIGLRTAPALTGPWSPPVVVYRPPESAGKRPFVYAAKAHPALLGPSPADLVVTYATNSFTFDDLLTAQGQRCLYWPRFIAVPLNR